MNNALNTARLTLRLPVAADRTRMAAFLAEFAVSSMLANVPHPYGLQHADDYISKVGQQWASAAHYMWALDDGDGLVGLIGLHLTERHSTTEEKMWELGYWVGKPYWGQGFVTEAGQAVLAEFDRHFPNVPVTAGYITGNSKSGRVLVKLGFQDTGRMVPLFCVARDAEVASHSLIRPPLEERIEP